MSFRIGWIPRSFGISGPTSAPRIAFEKYSHAKKMFNENSKIDGHICSRLRNKSGQSARKALKPITNCLLSPVKSRPPMTQRRSPRLAKMSPHKNGSKEDSGICTPSKYRHKLFTEVQSK